MDEIDKKILAELQSNARLTNQELADRVALSPSPCLRRVRALEKQGIIRGYHASVDQEACGLPVNVFVLVKLEKPTEENMQDFEQHIEVIDEGVRVLSDDRQSRLPIACSERVTQKLRAVHPQTVNPPAQYCFY